MELMDTSLDKFYRKVLDKNMTIPEDILGEIAVSVSNCLRLGWGWGSQLHSQRPQPCPSRHRAQPNGDNLGIGGSPVWP